MLRLVLMLRLVPTLRLVLMPRPVPMPRLVPMPRPVPRVAADVRLEGAVGVPQAAVDMPSQADTTGSAYAGAASDIRLSFSSLSASSGDSGNSIPKSASRQARNAAAEDRSRFSVPSWRWMASALLRSP